MRILRFLYNTFIFPNQFFVILFAMYQMYCLHLKELRSDEINSQKNKGELFVMVMNRILADIGKSADIVTDINRNLGIFKYIFSAIVWYAIINLIFF